MYLAKKRLKAVKLLIQYDMSCRQVIRELGYPNSRTTLSKWYLEYKQSGKFKDLYRRKSKYSIEKQKEAVKYYLEHGKCVSRTVRKLGFPSRPTLMKWIEKLAPGEKKVTAAGGVMIKYNQDEKIEAVLDFHLNGNTANEVASTHGVSRISLYNWNDQLLSNKGKIMFKKSKHKKKLTQNSSKTENYEMDNQTLLKERNALEQENYRLRIENDILSKAAEIIKKEEGINLKLLTNNDKAMVINALRNKHPLSDLLKRINMAKSSYFYQVSCINSTDKYHNLREIIRNIFNTAYKAYGYRRIHVSLKNNGIIVSEKVVRKIMREEGLKVIYVKKKKYSSYLGEISPAVDNILERDFKASKPNEKWLTDLTEFAIPAGKVYLSPIIDCFDGLPVSWSISTSPNAELVNGMLDNAIRSLNNDEKPILHSDRGAHYRWPGWIERMEDAQLTRSMSKKGCSPDNSACEGFFGTVKNEMFYSFNWANYSIKEFIAYLNKYLDWYSQDRIKISLGGMSPINYRKNLKLTI